MAASEARLRVEQGAAPASVHVVLPGRVATLGRGPGADIRLADAALAPRHAQVRLDASGLQVVDLGAPGGTRRNGVPLTPGQPADLRAGDALSLGAHLLRVDLLGDARPPARAPGDPAVPPDEFEVLRELGRGASGRVLSALRRRDGRAVAIKVLRGDAAPGSVAHARFVREGELCAKVQSPHVVEALERRVVLDRALIVMELVDGPSLSERLAAGPLPLGEALRVAEEVALALAAAAKVGVVHRDVKPANILLCPRAGAKLADFGMGKDLDAVVASLTATGQGLGTLAYMPPEQLSEARTVDARADVYSLGAVLYELLAGAPPFLPRTAADLAAIVDAAPPPLAGRRPDLPPALVALVSAMLAKDPADRPPAKRVVEALRALIG